MLKGAFKQVMQKRKLEKKRFIIFGSDLTLHGVSRSLNESYGISNKFCYGIAKSKDQVLKLTDFCPNIDTKEIFLKNLVEKKKLNVLFDTFPLKQKIMEYDLFKYEEFLMKEQLKASRTVMNSNRNILNLSEIYKKNASENGS